MLPSFATALTVTDRRDLMLLSWVLATGMLLGMAALAAVRRAPLTAPWASVDVAVAITLLLIGCWTVPPELRTGTWEGFQLAYTLCVAISLLGLQHRGYWLWLLTALAATEIVYLAPTVNSVHDVPSVIGNLLTLAVLAPLAWYGARVLIRIGTEADEARRFATSMAQAEEERRARLAIHNGTAMLRLLVDHGEVRNGLPADDRLRAQAEVEINRMRAYLRGEPPPRTTSDLAALVTSVAHDFPELPLTVIADLAQGVDLPGSLAGDLDAALRSLLLNVRSHAGATRVMLHAEEPESGRGWSVTVHDDGIGFDTDDTRFGVGLGEVVVGQLATHDVAATVESIPGIGTTVTLIREDQ